MKKLFAALLIAVVCLSVLGLHAWKTWGEIDGLSLTRHSDREFFEYSLFLESFAFMVSAAYFAGPKIYRLFGEDVAALRFEGEKEGVSRLVHIYSAVGVVLRRLSFDYRAGVSPTETMIVISLISAPAVLAFVKRKHDSRPKSA
jgi:hypothetical protein